MDTWNLIVDVSLCINCHNCTLASKDEHVGNDFPGYAGPQPRHGVEWIRIERIVRGVAPMVDTAYRPLMCNQCANPPCVAMSPPGAVYARPDGIVIIDPVKAKGRREIVDCCPYDAITWNEELQLPQKWIFEAHLLDAGWKSPRVVQVCPTDALQAIKRSDEEMAAIAREEMLSVRDAELGTRPRIFYKNSARFSTWFLGGSVVSLENDIEVPGCDLTVELENDEGRIEFVQTDDFGDFKFDGLPTVAGKAYTVRVLRESMLMTERRATLDGSIVLDPLHIDRPCVRAIE